MKTKTLLLVCLFMGMGLTQLFAQTIKKDAVLAITTVTATLKPDVTVNQYLDFMQSKYIPEWEKSFPGTKMYILYGERGEKKFQYATLLYFESVQLRDKYWPAEDKSSPEGIAGAEKMKAINAESAKFVLDVKSVYTDWVIK